MSEPKKPELWTISETAEYYRVTERTIRTWVGKGAVEAIKKGGTVRIVPDRATSTTTSAA